jgi:hypothetical protein
MNTKSTAAKQRKHKVYPFHFVRRHQVTNMSRRSNRTRSCRRTCLGDGDLAALKLLSLGDENAEDTVLHRSVSLF